MDLSGDETAIIKDSSVADSADIGKNNTELRNFPIEGLLLRRENCLEKGTKGERDGKRPREGNCKDAASHSGSAKKQQEEGKKDLGPSFKPQYMAIKTSRERKEGSQTLGKIGNFSRAGGGVSVGGGGAGGAGFAVVGNTRQFAAKNFHDTDGCHNISSSVDHDGLVCLACDPPHSLVSSMSRGEPVAVVVCDQNFPPIMPAKDGKCVVVIRVEDGRLFELERAFKDIFSSHCAPHDKLPLGSIVLVGSLSHLARYGLESYTCDLNKTLFAVGGLVGGGGRRRALRSGSVGWD
jgi:hypothetical protein